MTDIRIHTQHIDGIRNISFACFFGAVLFQNVRKNIVPSYRVLGVIVGPTKKETAGSMGTTSRIKQKVAELIEGQRIGCLRIFVAFCCVQIGTALMGGSIEHQFQRGELQRNQTTQPTQMIITTEAPVAW